MNSSSEAHDPRARQNVAELRRSEPTVADWRAFSEATSPEAYAQSWLALQCLMIPGCSDGVVVLQKPGTQEFVPAAFWPAEEKRDRSHLAEVTERALREARALVNSREVPSVLDPERTQLRYQLAYPVKVEGSLRGVVTVEVDQRPESQLESVMRQRLDQFGLACRFSLACAEEEDAVAKALGHLLRAKPTAILVASTTAPAGPADVIGRAMAAAGCQLERFLAPVEPGNLLLLGYKDDVPVVSAPGCFRSAKTNVVDLILPPMLARYRVSGWEIAGLGHGGLLS